MSPDEQRAQAAEMRRLASQAKDPDVREQYLLMAADWEKLAAEAEKQPHGAPAEPKAGRRR